MAIIPVGKSGARWRGTSSAGDAMNLQPGKARPAQAQENRMQRAVSGGRIGSQVRTNAAAAAKRLVRLSDTGRVW